MIAILHNTSQLRFGNSQVESSNLLAISIIIKLIKENIQEHFITIQKNKVEFKKV